ncbi:MAG: short chain dehydrogenase/reductase family oxidoreductase [Xanthobacteraceae bacterium]|nr:MAG: short chain dehydrogenase/reductase family oxidoreductase [Xanthobacteraceae bacterium]
MDAKTDIGTPRASARLRRYGPVAVITGASDGIGRAMALDLAGDGFGLVLAARRRDRLEAVAAEAEKRSGLTPVVVAGDLGTDAGIEALVAATSALDVGLLVCAAGFGTSGPFHAADSGNERDMLRLNCESAMLTTHHFTRRFIARGKGGIVLMSSLVAFQGVPRAAHYAATKAYIQTLAEGLRRELAPLGVDVVASAPGPVSTGFAARAAMTMGSAEKPEVVARQTLAALGRKTTVRPGFLAKLLEASLAPLPRGGRVRIMELVMRGMTTGQGHGQETSRRS